MRASPLGQKLAEATGAELDRAGRVIVDDHLRIPGHPNVFVVGDLAHREQEDGSLVPGVAPGAMQGGTYVADVIKRELRGKPTKPFRYRDKGQMATIGRARAVVDLGWFRFTGFFAWLAWLFIHLLYLVAFQNRLLVLIQWGWNYLTRGRSSRLIVGDDAHRSVEPQPAELAKSSSEATAG